jgi:hypothetical protein
VVSVISINPRRLRDAKHRSIKREGQAPPSAISIDSIDPVGQIATLLAGGAIPEQLRSSLTPAGLQALLGSFSADLDHDQEQELERLKKTRKQYRAKDLAAPRSAVRVHKTEAGWIAAAQRLVCTPDWVMDPWRARVICATAAEARRIEALLRVDPAGRGKDPLDDAFWLVENIYAPGSVAECLTPTLLARDVRRGDQFGEVFLARGCWGLLPEHLLPVVRATSVGLHLLA